MRTAIALLPFAILGACSPSRDARIELAPGEYVAAFQAARDVLREQWYQLDRVDARAGVLTTQPNPRVLRGPDDIVDRHGRVVRVEFTPYSPAALTDATIEPVDPLETDLTASSGPLTMRVRVLVERTQEPGWRPSPVSARMGGHAIDDDLVARGLQPSYVVAAREDGHLAGDLAAMIQTRMRGLIAAFEPRNVTDQK